MNDDDDLLKAISASAKRGENARVSPLDDVARERIVQRVVQSYPPARARTRWWRGRSGAVAGALALAATLAVFIGRRGSAPDELPAYELTIHGGARDLRGDPTPGDSLRLRQGDRFELLLRPPRALDAKAGSRDPKATIAARAFLARDAEAIPFAAPVDVAPEGAVRVAGSLADFPGASPGHWSLTVVVGRPDAVTGSFADVSHDGANRKTYHAPVDVE